MRKFVKCVDTGLECRREDAYYAEKSRRYFSSEEAYIKWSQPDPYWHKVINLFIEYSNFPKGAKLPGAFLKRLKDNYKGVGFEAVYMALVDKKPEILYRMEINEFDSYAKKLNYILKMIDGDIPDKVAEIEKLKKEILRGKKQINEREVPDVNIESHHQPRKDLSALIGL